MHHRIKIKNFLLLGCMLVMLSACGAVVAGGAAVTATSAAQERGVGGRAVDARIQGDINNLWFQESTTLFRLLDLKVYNRRVMVMGFVPNEEIRTRALNLVWQVVGVREVINEVQIGDQSSVLNKANDQWIETKIDSKLTIAKGVHNLNYTTQVINGIVYILGVARSDAEYNKVVSLVQNIKGVKHIVTYIEVLS